MKASNDGNAVPDLEQFRSYLKLLADLHLNPRLRVKEDSSDIVQQAMLEAYRDFHDYRGRTDAELRGWLKMILTNNINRPNDFAVTRDSVPTDSAFPLRHLSSTRVICLKVLTCAAQRDAGGSRTLSTTFAESRASTTLQGPTLPRRGIEPRPTASKAVMRPPHPQGIK